MAQFPSTSGASGVWNLKDQRTFRMGSNCPTVVLPTFNMEILLVGGGGSGGKAAAPIAKQVIKKVLERHELRRNVNNLIGEPV